MQKKCYAIYIFNLEKNCYSHAYVTRQKIRILLEFSSNQVDLVKETSFILHSTLVTN